MKKARAKKQKSGGATSDRLMTVQEISQMLNCSDKTTRLLIREGTLRACRLRIGGTFHARPADVQSMLDKLTLQLSGARR